MCFVLCVLWNVLPSAVINDDDDDDDMSTEHTHQSNIVLPLSSILDPPHAIKVAYW